jgi:hypothetical protein
MLPSKMKRRKHPRVLRGLKRSGGVDLLLRGVVGEVDTLLDVALQLRHGLGQKLLLSVVGVGKDVDDLLCAGGLMAC